MTFFYPLRSTKFGNLLMFNRNQLLETLIQEFKTCVGDKGTLIIPTFSYSFSKNQIFDVKNTKSTTGALSENFRKSSGYSKNDSTHAIMCGVVIIKNFYWILVKIHLVKIYL